ncbi:MAG: hypothetical protein M3Q57_04855 [Pseudomonadota bacterium]|nr:hypothetical protein [Pseudomonadota bacterium]
MRILVPATAALLLAACGTTPRPVAPTSVTTAQPPQRGGLIGLEASELAARFGQPRLQVREGVGTKLQYATAACVLDAYLYPPASGAGVARVAHVDTRNREGRSVDQSGCIAAIDTGRP